MYPHLPFFSFFLFRINFFTFFLLIFIFSYIFARWQVVMQVLTQPSRAQLSFDQGWFAFQADTYIKHFRESYLQSHEGVSSPLFTSLRWCWYVTLWCRINLQILINSIFDFFLQFQSFLSSNAAESTHLLLLQFGCFPQKTFHTNTSMENLGYLK